MKEESLKPGQSVYLLYQWDKGAPYTIEDFTYKGKTPEGYQFLYKGQEWDDATIIKDLSQVFTNREAAVTALEELNNK